MSSAPSGESALLQEIAYLAGLINNASQRGGGRGTRGGGRGFQGRWRGRGRGATRGHHYGRGGRSRRGPSSRPPRGASPEQRSLRWAGASQLVRFTPPSSTLFCVSAPRPHLQITPSLFVGGGEAITPTSGLEPSLLAHASTSTRRGSASARRSLRQPAGQVCVRAGSVAVVLQQDTSRLPSRASVAQEPRRRVASQPQPPRRRPALPSGRVCRKAPRSVWLALELRASRLTMRPSLGGVSRVTTGPI